MKLVTLLLAGISLGSMYALVAMGFVMIYRASGVLNFAHGAFVFAGAFAIAVASPTWGFWPAAAFGILLVIALAVATERVLVRRRGIVSPVTITIVTIGLDIILFTFVSGLLGSDILSLHQPWGGQTLSWGGVGISVNRLIGLLTAAVLIGALLLAFRYTSWGMQMRAVAADREAAAITGIRVGRVVAISWGVAGLLAGVAAIFLTGAPTPGLTPAISLVALVAFPAAVIGGLNSVPGALVGGLLIGVAESLATGYQEELAFLGRGFGVVVPYVLLIVVLIIRPAGLFGSREVTRA